MVQHTLTESDIEQAALAWLAELGWQAAQGPETVDSERIVRRAT